MRMVALIPARGGSKRVPHKNVREFRGHPLLVWSIASAARSGAFSDIVVSTDDDAIAEVARSARGLRGSAEFFVVYRPPELASDESSDIAWVRHALGCVDGRNAFAILRPTSPFRSAGTIRRALNQFMRSEVHSLRAVQPVKEHPGKMWQRAGDGYPITPLIGREWPAPMPDWMPVRLGANETPWHSRPTQTLPQVYVQNASLEMAWSYVIPAFGTISGRKVAPFFTQGYEGFDINTEDDWQAAERIAREHPELLTEPTCPKAC